MKHRHMITNRHRDRPRTPDGRVWLCTLMLVLSGLPQTHATGLGHGMTGGPRIPPSPSRQVQSGRTPAAHIGSVMAILATFHEAGVLPPESSSEANRLIHALIQFQSMFLKSSDPVVRDLFSSALSEKFDAKKAASLTQAFAETGWTSETLEALADYSAPRSMVEDPRVANAFRDYNVTTTDWKFIEQMFTKARAQLLKQGKQVHTVFATQRASMPGARQTP